MFQKKMVTLAVARAIAASALIVGSGAAQASGFQLMEQNASGLGNSYAGQAAAAENASTIFFNPAGLSLLPGKQISGSFEFINPSAKFNDSGLSRSPIGAPLGAGGGTGGDAGGWATIPNMYASWQVTNSIWAGVGITAPFGLKTSYAPGWIGRYQSQTADLKVIDIQPTVAWKAADWLSVGGGISFQSANLSLDRTIFTGGAFQNGTTNLKVDDTSWGWNVGAMITPLKDTRIGVTYRSTVKYTLTGNVVAAGTAPLGPTAAGVTADLKMPDTWSLAASQKFGDWQILADYTYTHWSTIKAVPIIATSQFLTSTAGTALDTFNLQFRNTYRAGLGLNWSFRPDLMFKIGAAYDKSPVTDPFRLTFLPDNNRTWGSIGVKWMPAKEWTLDFGYAHLWVSDPVIAQNQGVGVAPFRGNVNGTYSSSVNIVGGQVTFSF
jgi:long-chain fatty acid transport protein